MGNGGEVVIVGKSQRRRWAPGGRAKQGTQIPRHWDVAWEVGEWCRRLWTASGGVGRGFHADGFIVDDDSMLQQIAVVAILCGRTFSTQLIPA